MRTTSRHTRGFTLFEVIIVIALLAIVSTGGLVVGLESYRGALWRSDQDTLRAALLHAREQAMNGVCAASTCTGPSPHGVYVGTNFYTIFEGSTYATRSSGEDEVLEGEPGVSRSGLAEVVFSPLTATVAVPGEILITNSTGKVSTTSINSEGAILWSD
jgi:prepilin-type N-terminal cleavage/methylation domain-containing protein